MNPSLEIKDNLAWITFDDPDSRVNILNESVMRTLDRHLDELAANTAVKAILIRSAKPDIFIAGADVKQIAQIKSPTDAAAASRFGHAILAKLEGSRVPVIALINGVCLGGGTELALACHYRIAADSKKVEIGLPEVMLGLIPGWGGTQRLPRLIGLRAALGLILTGSNADAKKALRLCLVNEIVPPEFLIQRGRQLAANFKPPLPPRHLDNLWPIRAIVVSQARKQTVAKTRGHYPAPLKALDAIGRGYEAEAKAFGEVVTTDVSKNLIRVFFLREAAKKTHAFPDAQPLPIHKVGVLGAGVMGAGIAQWCAARNLTVRLKDVKTEFVAAGMSRIRAVFDEGVKRRKLTPRDAERGLGNVWPTTDYTGFGTCDLVIEAVLEQMDTKKKLFGELSALLNERTILATNTSALSIDAMAAAYRWPERVVGIHFFNPVHKMPLVEIVVGSRTSPDTAETAVALTKALGKTVIVCKDSPGFLVNRILLPYLNEAGRLLLEGNTIAAIDKAMLDFGMPMGPLRLTDEVGIDVGYHVARELSEAFPGRAEMAVAAIIQKLFDDGLKGRKGGRGFYNYHGREESPNTTVESLAKSLPGYQAAPSSSDQIQKRLVGIMIAEARRCLAEGVVKTEDDVDTGMIFGTGFPPFRGGLMHYAQTTTPLSNSQATPRSTE